MVLFEYFIIYIVIWWILFFISLPLGVKRSENLLPGQDTGAPEKTYLWKKFTIVSLISLIFTYIVAFVLKIYM
jgi:predicted secreted protein|tara:strand:+ start:1524 stop:1742 length:219 start_codon:yes stop_codon:yes gene_type:complete